MKTFISLYEFTIVILLASFVLPIKQAVASHGGRNGGDILEIELNLIAAKIIRFLETPQGRETFNMLNIESMKEVKKLVDFDTTHDELRERFGTIRTAINEPDLMKITVNYNKWNSVTDKCVRQIIVFHELLGLKEIELGYSNNVSVYPISSKLYPYCEIVDAISPSDQEVRPEYFRLKNMSWGHNIVNRDTRETLRLICLENVETYRCQKFNIVRKFKNIQKPFVDDIVKYLPKDLEELHAQIDKVDLNSFNDKALERLPLIVKNLINSRGTLTKMDQVEEVSDALFTSLEEMLLGMIRQQNPDFYLSNKLSWGTTLKNTETKEILKIVCAEDRVISDCEKFKIVREVNMRQFNILGDDKTINKHSIELMHNIVRDKIRASYTNNKMRNQLEIVRTLLNYNFSSQYVGHYRMLKSKQYESIAELLSQLTSKINLR